MRDTDKETITDVAIVIGKKVYVLPKPKRHSDIIKIMADLKTPVFQESQQGFFTSKNRFVSRKEAAQIAFSSGQITKEIVELHSEDVW